MLKSINIETIFLRAPRAYLLLVQLSFCSYSPHGSAYSTSYIMSQKILLFLYRISEIFPSVKAMRKLVGWNLATLTESSDEESEGYGFVACANWRHHKALMLALNSFAVLSKYNTRRITKILGNFDTPLRGDFFIQWTTILRHDYFVISWFVWMRVRVYNGVLIYI